jgi:hypothetical protein
MTHTVGFPDVAGMSQYKAILNEAFRFFLANSIVHSAPTLPK